MENKKRYYVVYLYSQISGRKQKNHITKTTDSVFFLNNECVSKLLCA